MVITTQPPLLSTVTCSSPGVGLHRESIDSHDATVTVTGDRELDVREADLGVRVVDDLLGVVDEHRRIALQRLGFIGVEVGDQRLEIEVVDSIEDRLHCTFRGVGTAGHHRRLGNVVATVT